MKNIQMDQFSCTYENMENKIYVRIYAKISYVDVNLAYDYLDDQNKKA